MATPTRVLHVITRLEQGGAQRNTLHTVATLDRSEFEPGLAWGPGDRLDDEARGLRDVALFEEPDLVRSPSVRCDMRALSGLRAVIRHWRPHLVHTHSSKAGVLGRLASRLERVPRTIHSIHGFGFTPLQPAPVRTVYLAAERLVARWTDVFIAVSRADARRGVELGLFDDDRVRLIRSGVDLERFSNVSGGAEARAWLDVPADAPLVVQVANLKPQKAPLDFVKVAAEVVRTLPETHFVLVGDGALRGRVESAVAHLGLGGRVVLPGWVDDVDGLMDAADVVLLTSRHEGLPRSVLEARAAGVPVVATAVDGTPEAIEHGVNGFLAPAGDVGALAAGVLRLLEDSSLRQRFGRAACESLEEFDIDRMVRQQEALYRWMLRSTST